LTIQVLSNDNAGKNKSYEKTNYEFVEFVSIPQKLHPFKNPRRLPTEPMGIHHNPHTHTIPIPMGIPMGIPIPTAALGHITRCCAAYTTGCLTNPQQVEVVEYGPQWFMQVEFVSVTRSGKLTGRTDAHRHSEEKRYREGQRERERERESCRQTDTRVEAAMTLLARDSISNC